MHFKVKMYTLMAVLTYYEENQLAIEALNVC